MRPDSCILLVTDAQLIVALLNARLRPLLLETTLTHFRHEVCELCHQNRVTDNQEVMRIGNFCEEPADTARTSSVASSG